MNTVTIIYLIVLLAIVMTSAVKSQDKSGSNWNAPDRADKVLALTPGKRLPNLMPETLFLDWTKQQVERWQQDHPGETIADVCERAVASTDGKCLSDAEIVADFPLQISPYGRARSGTPDDLWKAERVLASGPPGYWAGYCPFCGSRTMRLEYDSANRYHAVTNCCRKDLYGANYPADYDLKSTATADFTDLDGNVHKVPTVIYKDKAGIEWDLFIPTIFANKRWDDMARLCTAYCDAFVSTADPVYAYKLALLLDKTADTYYALLPSYVNELCKGKDGKPLTRAEWEAVKRPSIFGPSYLGEWNRRGPMFNRGWLRQVNESVWVEPFARVRHHPAFKYYSQKVYGDPEALDRKVRQKLMREIALTWESVAAGGMLTDYQDAIYTNELLLAVLSEQPSLLDFAAPNNELTLYNHYYSDGLCGEGAANYMAMPGGYYFAPLRDSKGTWQSIYPDFLKEHPFFEFAANEWRNLKTLRGLELEFGDEHVYAFNKGIQTDPEKVRERENAGSANWPAWGFGMLRVGGSGHRMEVTMDYTRVAQHTTSDPLGISCWVDGIPVMRPGGYGAGGLYLPLQWERPEMQGLQKMGYPKEIAEAKDGELAFGGWTHSPMAQNTITVNETFPSMGWRDNRGYGELIAYKGGENPGDPGAHFQILESRDRYSFDRVGQRLKEFRRALLGVEGPDGRPYVIDITTVRGGQRHALFSSAVAERAEAVLPSVIKRVDNLYNLLKPSTTDAGELFGKDAQIVRDRTMAYVRNCEILEKPKKPWSLTWMTDYTAYATRDVKGEPFVRPLPDDTGKVSLRLLGLPTPGQDSNLIRAKGPWVSIIDQPLSNGTSLYGNVGFLDANDMLIETHKSAKCKASSRFVHLIEGYRENEKSFIKSVKMVSIKNASPTSIAIKMTRTDGLVDIIIYQETPRLIKLDNGITTDARYALVRFGSNGKWTEAHMVEGSTLQGPGMKFSSRARFTGTISDIVGDLTGTRRESALIVKPDKSWPKSVSSDKLQVIVEGPNTLRVPFREAYTIDKITEGNDGTVRLDIAGTPPLAIGWHQVTELDPKRPNFFRTNRPMLSGSETPWYAGMNVWFPRLSKTFKFKDLTGGFHMSTEGLMDNVNLTEEGVKPSDWFLIHFLKPGMKVSLINSQVWRR